MTTLISLTQWQETDAATGSATDIYLARWRTDDGITFDAMHGANGRSLYPVRPFGVTLKVPKLTAAQMAEATPAPASTGSATDTPVSEPVELTARDLAAKGSAACPHLANRMNKAADLVEAGAVRLTGDETAVVSSSQDYNISGERCPCDWQKHHPGDHCSHSLAVRMARALGQAHEPHSEDEKEARSAAVVEANRDYKLRRKAEVQKFARERDAKHNCRFVDGDGARTYVRMAMANGAKTIPQHIMNRAQPGRA